MDPATNPSLFAELASGSGSSTSAKPYTPKTNGKAERFIQTSLREWAYAQAYPNSRERKAELVALAGLLLAWNAPRLGRVGLVVPIMPM